MSTGERAKLLMVQVLEYSGKYRPLTPVNRQVDLLESLFECRRKRPWTTRIDEAVRGRAGLLTEARLRERAENLGLIPKPDSPWLHKEHPRAQSARLTRGTDNDGADYIDRLRAMQRAADPANAAALEWAIRQYDAGQAAVEARADTGTTRIRS